VAFCGLGGLPFRGCWCWSDAHVSMASSSGGSGEIGCSLGRKSEKGGQAARREAAPRGANFFLAGKHVPDRVGEPAGDVDLGDFGTALLSEPALWFAGSAR
jgi:hypothetical protein